MSLRRSLRARNGRDDLLEPDSNAPVRSTRRSRAVSSTSVTISRSSAEQTGDSPKSIRLTVKMPSNKLREATGGSSRGGASTKRSVNVFTENPIVSGPRTSRPNKRLIEVDTSDEEDLSDQEEDEIDDDAPGDEDEDADADGDLDMDDAPPQPPVSKRHAKASAPAGKSIKGVEAKEMELNDEEDEDDDEELSEPDSDAEGEADEQDESAVKAGDEELGDEEDEEDLELDSDDAATGDPNKMTKRQRGSLGNDFLQLPMEPQVKKHLTAEERAMRRTEMARRRKNLSEKRNEEEKMDTINRLLRKQAPKRRGRIPAAEAAEAASGDQETQEVEKVDPIFARWVSGRDGSRLGVPNEWLGTPAGRPFENHGPRKLVEEV
ncbi:PAPA-1-like domain-containing protein [Aspergillus candidus]|uniref:PAPA-1-like conserved region-domain-containing protein n=1 Tax=Aspergillus candidus TaxID=41067 RepID=A0A2I2FHX0_ASPCN|nr:PAPA-1-like conserved region-domain-containing protein [Aspergillus candidus]PLB40209.1 PAPA-1-like conserved region-domain-containing protein [Aspergillus candidus]